MRPTPRTPRRATSTASSPRPPRRLPRPTPAPWHDATAQTPKTKQFAEQAAVPTRTMYATQSRRTTHRLAALDVPVPSWMRAPGEAPGMFALESAMDEMATSRGLDPVDFRI